MIIVHYIEDGNIFLWNDIALKHYSLFVQMTVFVIHHCSGEMGYLYLHRCGEPNICRSLPRKTIDLLKTNVSLAHGTKTTSNYHVIKNKTTMQHPAVQPCEHSCCLESIDRATIPGWYQLSVGEQIKFCYPAI